MTNSLSKLSRVVLIDDSETDNYLHRLVIKKSGLVGEILEFSEALKALEFLENREDGVVDLIFLDINMPVMNGFEFMEAYQHMSPEKQAKAVVVFLTSSEHTIDRERASHFSGISGFETKPLTAESFEDIVLKLQEGALENS